MTKIEIEAKDLKMLRETLCIAQGWFHWKMDEQDAEMHSKRLEILLDQIDEKRPLGPDGNHGNLHTPECGCENWLDRQEERMRWSTSNDAVVLD